MKVLLIEDNKELVQIVKRHCQLLHIAVDGTYTGEDGLRLVRTAFYDVVIVDLLLDIALNGLDVVRQIRKFDHYIPIVVWSGLTDIETKLAIFQAGADDFVAKPGHLDEVVARLKRLCQRSNRPFITQVAYHGMVYDVTKRCLSYKEQKLYFKQKEAHLLEYMMHHHERPLSRAELIAAVWHLTDEPKSNVVDVTVRKLRLQLVKQLGVKCIHTVHGRGYRFGLGLPRGCV
ncbi:response regulator transcription factor [Candidatus Gracilibacteria bacterium]|nr:response regulator transcription factor [Candidatus Gracilibacteria bacterium]